MNPAPLVRLRADLLVLENFFAAVLSSARPLLEGTDSEIRKTVIEEFTRSIQRQEAALEGTQEMDLAAPADETEEGR